MNRFFILFAFTALTQIAHAQPIVQLQTFATGFTRPVDIASAGDARLFIVEQAGIIHILDSLGQRLPTPFLDIRGRINSSANERGLLGLVFHPNYEENGYFYVNYTNTSGHTRISRFRVTTANTNVADPDSELILLGVNQPFSNHNAGDLNFGPDGYLYFGLGDGGSGGDPNNNGQNRQSFLGKMIRIDVNNGNPYAVPADNPFVNDPSTLNEIWAIGLRNPWRFSFDRLTGDMWLSDVGQNSWEEINFQPASSAGGENYGWRCYEGNNTYNTSGCQPISAYTFPIHTYPNNFNNGCSVTGGFVYRGSDFPDLYGHYIYTDYCSGRIWSLTPNGQGGWTNRQLLQGASNQYATFGENHNGELFLATRNSGVIQRVRELCSPFQVSGAVADETCFGQSDGRIDLGIENPGATHTIAWSTGENTPSLGSLAPGTYSVSVTNSISCVRTLSFTVAPADSIPAPQFQQSELTICSGATAQLIAPEAPVGFSYQWYLNEEPVPGATEQTLTTDEAGAYSVAFISPEGCSSPPSEPLLLSIDIFPVLPPIEVNGNLLFVADLDIVISYQWYLNGQPIPGANGPTYTALESGDYFARAITIAGCVYEWDPVQVTVSSIAERIGLQRFVASPNPTRDLLNIDLEMSESSQLTLRLLDISGKTVWERRERVTGAWRIEADMSKLPAGQYSLVLLRGRQHVAGVAVVKA